MAARHVGDCGHGDGSWADAQSPPSSSPGQSALLGAFAACPQTHDSGTSGGSWDDALTDEDPQWQGISFTEHAAEAPGSAWPEEPQVSSQRQHLPWTPVPDWNSDPANGQGAVERPPRAPEEWAQPVAIESEGILGGCRQACSRLGSGHPRESERSKISRAILRTVAAGRSFFAVVVCHSDDGPLQPFEHLRNIALQPSNVRERVQDLAVERLDPETWLLTGFLCDLPSVSMSNDLSLSGPWARRPMYSSNVISSKSRKRPCRQGDRRRLQTPESEPSSDSDCDVTSGPTADRSSPALKKNERWSDADSDRLLSYVAQGRAWEEIYGKFPTRTPGAVKLHWYTEKAKREGLGKRRR